MASWTRGNRGFLIIWDWGNAQILLELNEQSWKAAEFIDDYRLLICNQPTSDTPPSIKIIDTGKLVEGVPIQTTFHLSPHFGRFGSPSFRLERGVHRPSPAESRAPFHQDPTQRIIALSMPDSFRYPVFRVQALLELLKVREGSEVGWDEWKSSVVIPSIDPNSPERVEAWVSGCRLFYLDSLESVQGTRMRVYDFSMQGRAKYLSERANEDLGGVRDLSPTEADGRVPWDIYELFHTRSGHDSIIFSRRFREFYGSQFKWELHIWTF